MELAVDCRHTAALLERKLYSLAFAALLFQLLVFWKHGAEYSFMCCFSGTLFPEFPSHVKAPVNYTQSSRIIRENSMSRAPDWQPQFYLSHPFPLATFKGNLKATHFIRASAFHTTHSLTLHRIEAYQLPHRHSQKEDARGYSEKKKGELHLGHGKYR